MCAPRVVLFHYSMKPQYSMGSPCQTMRGELLVQRFWSIIALEHIIAHSYSVELPRPWNSMEAGLSALLKSTADLASFSVPKPIPFGSQPCLQGL